MAPNLKHLSDPNLLVAVGEELHLPSWSGRLNGLPHSHIPSLSSLATTEGILHNFLTQ